MYDVQITRKAPTEIYDACSVLLLSMIYIPGDDALKKRESKKNKTKEKKYLNYRGDLFTWRVLFCRSLFCFVRNNNTNRNDTTPFVAIFIFPSFLFVFYLLGTFFFYYARSRALPAKGPSTYPVRVTTLRYTSVRSVMCTLTLLTTWRVAYYAYYVTTLISETLASSGSCRQCYAVRCVCLLLFTGTGK